MHIMSIIFIVDNLLVIGKLNLFNENGSCHVSIPAVTGNCNFNGW